MKIFHGGPYRSPVHGDGKKSPAFDGPKTTRFRTVTGNGGPGGPRLPVVDGRGRRPWSTAVVDGRGRRPWSTVTAITGPFLTMFSGTLSVEIWGSPGIGLYISFPDCGTNLRTESCLYTKSARNREGRAGGGNEGQRGDTGGLYSGGAHRATSNGVLISMCELVASRINTLPEVGC